MWHVWLVWILTTKRKSMKRAENFERYVIFSCYYLLICSSNGFVFVVLTCYVRFLSSNGFYSPDINPFWFVPHWILIVCSFVFEWRNHLGIWNDAQIFCFCGVSLCFHAVLTTEGVIIPFDLHWAVKVKIISSCLCSPVVVPSAMRQIYVAFNCCD